MKKLLKPCPFPIKSDISVLLTKFSNFITAQNNICARVLFVAKVIRINGSIMI